MLSAFCEAMTGRGPDLLRAYFLAVAIQVLAVNALVGGRYLTAALPPFFGLATAIGSVLYGMGMFVGVWIGIRLGWLR